MGGKDNLFLIYNIITILNAMEIVFYVIKVLYQIMNNIA